MTDHLYISFGLTHSPPSPIRCLPNDHLHGPSDAYLMTTFTHQMPVTCPAAPLELNHT